MDMKRLIFIAGAAICLAISGCGLVEDIEEQQHPYPVYINGIIIERVQVPAHEETYTMWMNGVGGASPSFSVVPSFGGNGVPVPLEQHIPIPESYYFRVRTNDGVIHEVAATKVEYDGHKVEDSYTFVLRYN